MNFFQIIKIDDPIHHDPNYVELALNIGEEEVDEDDEDDDSDDDDEVDQDDEFDDHEHDFDDDASGAS